MWRSLAGADAAGPIAQLLTIVKPLSPVGNRLKTVYRSWTTPSAGRNVSHRRHRGAEVAQLDEQGLLYNHREICRSAHSGCERAHRHTPCLGRGCVVHAGGPADRSGDRIDRETSCPAAIAESHGRTLDQIAVLVGHFRHQRFGQQG